MWALKIPHPIPSQRRFYQQTSFCFQAAAKAYASLQLEILGHTQQIKLRLDSNQD